MWLAIFAFSCEAALAAVASLEGTSPVKCIALGAMVGEYKSLEEMRVWRCSKCKEGGQKGAMRYLMGPI